MEHIWQDYMLITGMGHGDYTDMEKIVITDGKVTHEGTFTPSFS